MDNSGPDKLGDIELALRLKRLAADERFALTDVIFHLMEFDRRRLYSAMGYPSLFSYCVQSLRLSENEAYKRVQTARVCHRYPDILNRLRSGELHLAATALLAPHLTDENHQALLAQASGKTKREVEALVAALAPKPARRDCVRRLSAPAAGRAGDFLVAESCAASGADVPATSVSMPPAPRVEPVSPGRVRFSFTGDEELLRHLERAREVLKRKYPVGRLEELFAEALRWLLDKMDPRCQARRNLRLRRQTPPVQALVETRRIPQWVKDAVWARDEGRCSFRTPDGARCAQRCGLEFDHVVPWALGGRSHDPKNIRLLCREHNQISWRRRFGASSGTGDFSP